MCDVVLLKTREVPYAELPFSWDGGYLDAKAKGVSLNGTGDVRGRASSKDTAEGVAF